MVIRAFQNISLKKIGGFAKIGTAALLAAQVSACKQPKQIKLSCMNAIPVTQEQPKTRKICQENAKIELSNVGIQRLYESLPAELQKEIKFSKEDYPFKGVTGEINFAELAKLPSKWTKYETFKGELFNENGLEQYARDIKGAKVIVSSYAPNPKADNIHYLIFNVGADDTSLLQSRNFIGWLKYMQESGLNAVGIIYDPFGQGTHGVKPSDKGNYFEAPSMAASSNLSQDWKNLNKKVLQTILEDRPPNQPKNAKVKISYFTESSSVMPHFAAAKEFCEEDKPSLFQSGKASYFNLVGASPFIDLRNDKKEQAKNFRWMNRDSKAFDPSKKTWEFNINEVLLKGAELNNDGIMPKGLFIRRMAQIGSNFNASLTQVQGAAKEHQEMGNELGEAWKPFCEPEKIIILKAGGKDGKSDDVLISNEKVNEFGDKLQKAGLNAKVKTVKGIYHAHSIKEADNPEDRILPNLVEGIKKEKP